MESKSNRNVLMDEERMYRYSLVTRTNKYTDDFIAVDE